MLRTLAALPAREEDMTTRTVICTTGTSIARGARRLDQCTSEEEYAQGIRDRANAVEEQSGDQFLAQVSAETHALIALGKMDEIVLLHTDTRDGEVCARELERLIERKMGIRPTLQRIEGLQVLDAARFRRVGVQNLFEALTKLREGRPPATHEVILNATGGVKGVVAYLTLYGLVYRLRVVYLFEFSDELVNLPPAPLSFDFEGIGRAAKALALVRREGAVTKTAFFDAIEGLEYHERERFEALIEEEDGLVTFSCFGQLLDDAREAGRAEVMLHERAKADYDDADGSERPIYDRLLKSVADPLWRSKHYHSFQGTDLSVWKMPHSQLRIAGIERGRRLHVCRLFLDHDRYERELAGAARSQFEQGRFQSWREPPGARELVHEDDLAAALAEQTRRTARAEAGQLAAMEQQEQLEAQLARAHAELEQLRAELDKALEA